MRTAKNFANLASFQATEFQDRPIPKTVDILVCQTSENKGFFTKRSILSSVTVVREEREHDLIASPVSTLSARSA